METITPKVNLRDCENIKCEKCDSAYFIEVIYIKKVSKLLTASAEDTTVPFPIYKCDECGHINKGFNPFEDTEEPKLTLND